jgi:thioredoxin-like negative regulator of GroEL
MPRAAGALLLIVLVTSAAAATESPADVPRRVMGVDPVVLARMNALGDSVGETLKTQIEGGDAEAVKTTLKAGMAKAPHPLEWRFVFGNVLYVMGEVEAALTEHRAAMADADIASLAAFNVLADLAALRRVDEACAARAGVPSGSDDAPAAIALNAWLDLRCGKPARGRDAVARMRRENHSLMEEILVHLFGQLGRYSVRRHALDAQAAAGSLDVGRARAELEFCGDFADPWHATIRMDDAHDRFEALAKSHPADCALAGRSAVTEIIRVERAHRDPHPAAEYDAARRRLAPFVTSGPACPEVVEAQAMLMEDDAPNAVAPRIAFLESAAKHFPDSVEVRLLLLDAYAIGPDEGARRATIEAAAARFPDSVYPFVRLALIAASGPAGPAGAIPILRKGLTARPDDTALNLLLALFLLDLRRFDDAVSPAARYLAVLLETRASHDDWAPGVSLLSSALDRSSPWPEDAKQHRALLDRLRGNHTLSPGPLRSSNGCTDVAKWPTQVPVWFRPAIAYGR